MSHDTPDPSDTDAVDARENGTGSASTLRRQLPALAVLGAIALLLIGVGIGLAVGNRVTTSSDRPKADSTAVGFAQDMSTHHLQATEMATAALSNAADPQVRSLAYDILTQQTNQVGQMQSWLTRWGYPLSNPGSVMGWMPDHSSMPGMDMSGGASMSMAPGDSVNTPLMPGMATSPELATLRGLRGEPFDVYFLQLMLRHHEGGAPMLSYAANKSHVSQGFVRDLAQQMLNLQQNEADAMTAMLAEKGAKPLPMN
ncbi:DUF305 domain-containing protein [Williamsia sp. CHRR-6]|uniref:DUF305 domain-containing protein n=1 Tax=Williamsia sp. CHRR-6 TaxID=2835871 RepID=UPI001BD954E0|nr:DUF305 domain-containing protein [Williamsia sp. CHRR-6]MBT0568438.1 DUF305 domain-containing protein [Williamsia sp. CHRR-6]